MARKVLTNFDIVGCGGGGWAFKRSKTVGVTVAKWDDPRLQFSRRSKWNNPRFECELRSCALVGAAAPTNCMCDGGRVAGGGELEVRSVGRPVTNLKSAPTTSGVAQ